jgi:hypothetical protein
MKNKVKPLLYYCVIILAFFGCTDMDDNLIVIDEVVTKPENIIAKDSELFQLISIVSTLNNTIVTEAVCVDFKYPMNLTIYDKEYAAIGTRFLLNDKQLSLLLEKMTDEQSLSISYPITTTLKDGTIFSINTNAELKLAIDSCSKEDIINSCNSSFCNANPSQQTPFVWNVQYVEDGSNKYISGFFVTNPDTTLTFNFNGIKYLGNWEIIFVNNELHINIKLEGDSPVAKYWNFDRKIILTLDSIKIFDSTQNIVLKKAYQTIEEYNIGDKGPSGGIVFYDKGFYSNGWRYMEMSLNDLGAFEWGCATSPVADSRNNNIGKGLYNTAAIVNFHDDLVNYYKNPTVCNALSNGTVSAKEAILYTTEISSDWFLPSLAELQLIYDNLFRVGKGNLTGSIYWSSSEIDAVSVNSLNFKTGETISVLKGPNTTGIKTRAVRYF